MAAPVTLSVEAKNEALDAALANLNGGTLKIYTGSAPASPDDSATGSLLATLNLNGTAFASASGGVATANAVSSAAAVLSGTGGYARMTKSGGSTGVLDAPVGGSQRVTASSSSGLLFTSLTAHGLSDTTQVELFTESGGVLPGNTAANTTYFIRDAAATTFKLALTSGGSAIAYADAGTDSFRVKLKSTAVALATKDGSIAEGVTVSVESFTVRF